MNEIKDRIKPFLQEYLKGYLFSELSPEYLREAGLDSFMTGVPVPLREEDARPAAAEGLAVSVLGQNMAVVLGVDPGFPYADAYSAYIKKFLGDKAFYLAMTEAEEAINRGDVDMSVLWHRTALVLSPSDRNAMYGYAYVLKMKYDNSTDKATIGSFRAESIEWFEMLADAHPDFAPAWYHLGYVYVNLGLYTKAKLAWEKYLELSEQDETSKEKTAESDPDPRAEIIERLAQLEEPVQIEQAVTAVLSGDYESGIAALSKFAEGSYGNWWPLHYHLGIARKARGDLQTAEADFKKVLGLCGTQTDTMRELIEIYEETGRFDLVKKYKDKLELIESDNENTADNDGDDKGDSEDAEENWKD